jgi:Zn ribbon nucleic-acid-binding protein
MAKREPFPAAIKCPQCKRTGTAWWEEYENPVYAGGDLGTTLKNVSAGFRKSSNEAYCDDCDVKAIGG